MASIFQRRETDDRYLKSIIDLASEDLVIDIRDDQRIQSHLRLVYSADRDRSFSMKWWKRPFDIGAAVALIGIFGLPILVIVLVLRITSTGPILFRQERVGRFGRIFVCFKFRTMHRDADRWLEDILRLDDEARAEWLDHQKLVDDPRVTPVGGWLRRTSLDELPQLFNVLKGDMSLVGPRPVVPAEALRYGDAIAQVLQVKPGITGLWQVSGRSKLCYAERIELDLDYCRSSSMGQDIIICLKTVKHVLPFGDNGAC